MIARGGGAVCFKTLAQLIAEQGLATVDLLVIDVEGTELPVLQGFPWADLPPLPRIFCELPPFAWPDFGYTGQELQAFLAAKGLRCIDMYFTEYGSFDAPNYIGPAVLMR